MEQKPLISVIVPVYNVEAYLARCVDSILAQTYENLEIILVEDGTKDSSGLICDEYARRDARVRVIHKENGGLSSARNAGVDIAQGDYLGFVDSDDWIEPEMYEQMVVLAQKYDTPLVCAGRYDVSSESDEQRVGLCPPEEELISGEELVRRIFRWDNIDSAAWDKLYARDLFRQIRYPFGRIVEDVPTTYRIALLAGRAAMCPKPFYNYFHRPGSITNMSVSEKTFHFAEHTRLVYDDIRENHPALVNEARYLYVRGLAYNIRMLDLASKESRARFAAQYTASRKALRKELSFVRESALFSKRERQENVLMALGLYRGLRSAYHLFRR